MNNQTVKLSDQLSLYSGDIITINNSCPLLVEIIDEQKQKIKLRRVDKNEYLVERKLTKTFSESLRFAGKFDKSLVFTVKNNDRGEINLQTNNEYLKTSKKDFHLSPEERWLTITKQKSAKKVADYEEIVNINLDKEKNPTSERIPITSKFYDNKTKDILKHNFEYTEQRQNEHTLTLTTDFTWGLSGGLNLNPSNIVGLKINGKLEEKLGTADSFKETKSITIKESFDFECPPWTKIQVKLEAKRIKTPYTAKIERTIGNRTYNYLVEGEYSRDDYSNHTCSHEPVITKNILLVGCTGSGKSTLAKVLSGEDDKFEEGEGSVSKTKYHKKSDEFEERGNYFCAIDNIGFGDTKLNEREELIRIGKAINSAYQGLSQVLFVFSDRFSDKEKEGIRKLAALKITNYYITLVRSKFDNFGNKGACEQDKKALEEESPEMSELINNCRGLLHIDNGEQDLRDKSRIKVLNYLQNNCEENPFKPQEWENITVLIEEYFKEKKDLESQKEQANHQDKVTIEQQIDQLKTTTAQQVKEELQGEGISEFTQFTQIVQQSK
jgi:energy-coupling factor transporter ATP-binding protein EcfA2